MTRACWRLLVALCLLALLGVPGTQQSASGASPLKGTFNVAFIASGHSGQVKAALGEQVEFVALASGALPPNESIAIIKVDPPLRLLALCGVGDRICTAAATATKPGLHYYRAVVSDWSPGASFFYSKTTEVEWKKLTVSAQFSGWGVQAAGPNAVSQVIGGTVTVQVSLPEGPSTSWQKIKIAGARGFTATCSVTAKCAPEIPARYSDASPPVPFTDTLFVKMLGAGGRIVKTDQYSINYRKWQVTFQAMKNPAKEGDPAGAPTQTLELAPAQGDNAAESGKLNMKITEPNVGQMTPYFEGLRIVSAADSSIFADCKITDKFDCTKDVSYSTDTHQYWAEVYALVNGSIKVLTRTGLVTVSSACAGQLAARRPSSERGRASLPSCPAQPPVGSYYIQYKISGGSGDCAPAPPEGYSGCHPGPGGSVQLTADVHQVINFVSSTPASLPAGYRIRWRSEPGIASMPHDCPLGQPTCTITVQDPGPANSVVDFYAQVERDSPFDTLAYDTLKLTVSWH